MSQLQKGIKQAIRLRGRTIVCSGQLVNILADLQAYKFRATRTIMRALVKGGYAEKILKMADTADADIDLKTRSIVQELSSQGYQPAHVGYAVECVVAALLDADGPEEPADAPADWANVVTVEVKGVTFNMIEVMGGRFAMGATPEQGLYAAFDEKPATEVEVDDFYIGETPVVQQLWNVVMAGNPSCFKGDALPVERVTWHECNDFMARLSAATGFSFRLPTEAEWEYAARGGRSSAATKYAGAADDGLPECAWHKENAGSTTHAVATKRPNELGLYDMSGNVSEWCSDWYFSSYSTGGAKSNPKGPAQGVAKVVRGGSWNDKPACLRVSRRNSMSPSFRSKQVGFRVVMTR